MSWSGFGAGAAAEIRGPAPFPSPGERSSGREGAPVYIQIEYEAMIKALVETLHTVYAPTTKFVVYSAEDVVNAFRKIGLKIDKVNACETKDHNIMVNVCLGVLPDERHVHMTVKKFFDTKGNEVGAKVTFVATIPQKDLKRRSKAEGPNCEEEGSGP